MLIDLIEHQKELFGAIMASLNYRNLNALKETCKALFAVVSGAHRWQHMHRMQSNLQQIISIRRAILRDITYGDVTTIIYIKKNITCYVSSIPDLGLDVYNAKYSIFGDNTNDIDGIIEYYPLESLIISNFIDGDAAPKWLLKCVEKIESEDYCFTEILDILP
jgi:hypothetical protein